MREWWISRQPWGYLNAVFSDNEDRSRVVWLNDEQ